MRELYCTACSAQSSWLQTDYVVKSLFYNVVLGSQIPQRTIIPTEVLTANAVAEDWAQSQPTLWGYLMLKEVPLEDWAVLNTPDLFETPTKAMRMELMGY